MKFDLLGLDDAVRLDVQAVAARRRFDCGVVLFHEGEAAARDEPAAASADRHRRRPGRGHRSRAAGPGAGRPPGRLRNQRVMPGRRRHQPRLAPARVQARSWAARARLAAGLLNRISRASFTGTFGPEFDASRARAPDPLINGCHQEFLRQRLLQPTRGLLSAGCQISFVFSATRTVMRSPSPPTSITPGDPVAAAGKEPAMCSGSWPSRRIPRAPPSPSACHPTTIGSGIIAVDTATTTTASAIFAEYYSCQARDEQSKFVLQPTDGRGFTHFAAETENCETTDSHISSRSISSYKAICYSSAPYFHEATIAIGCIIASSAHPALTDGGTYSDTERRVSAHLSGSSCNGT